jgi:hypothetical protein
MHEYHELVSAFHAEQESHTDLDGEELVSREDVAWLLRELTLRFEDLLVLAADAADEERARTTQESPVADAGQEGGVGGGAEKEARKATPPSPRTNGQRVGEREGREEGPADGTEHALRKGTPPSPRPHRQPEGKDANDVPSVSLSMIPSLWPSSLMRQVPCRTTTLHQRTSLRTRIQVRTGRSNVT